MVKEKLFQELAINKNLQGNDLRLFMLCLGRDVYPKEAAMLLGWRKQNVSKSARKLESLGLLRVNNYPVFYRSNEKWAESEIS